MNVKELIISMVDDVENKYTLQAVFDRHLTVIENLKANGVTYKQIFDLLNENNKNQISLLHFRNLIFKSKKKLKDNVLTKIENLEPETLTKPKTEILMEEEKQVNSDDDNAINEINNWRLETNLSFTSLMISRLKKHNYTPEKLKEKNFKHVTQVQKLLTHLDNELASKLRKQHKG